MVDPDPDPDPDPSLLIGIEMEPVLVSESGINLTKIGTNSDFYS